MVFRDKGAPGKRKATSDDECYNCHKFGHFGRDCFLPDRRLNRTTQQSLSRREESRRGDSRRGGGQHRGRSGGRSDTPNRAHQASENKIKHDDDSVPEPFAPGPVGTAFMVKEQRDDLQRTSQSNSPWFLDSCASRHLCNDRRLFISTRAKSIDFVTAASQIIRTEGVGTVSIPLTGGRTIKLHNVALAPNCDSNLISLGQLRESGISYHDNPSTMTLMRGGEIIAHAKRDHNLFTLEAAIPGQVMSAISRSTASRVMAITGRGRPTHLVSQNKRIRLWHRRLAHASNARVIKASKLTDGIDLGLAKEYNPAEVFVDSENSDADSSGDDSQPKHSVARQFKADTDNIDALDKLCAPCWKYSHTVSAYRTIG